MENNNLVFNHEGILVVSSRVIADDFGKEHSDVLKKIHGSERNGEHIDGILDQFDSGENTLEYFIPNEYKDSSGKSNKEYLATKDGFSLLVMGFTGAEALRWKVKYIKAFNSMEEELKNINQIKSDEYRDFVAQLYGEVYNIKSSLELLKDSYNGCNINTTEELTERLRSERWLVDGAISNKGLKELCLVVLDGEICVSKKALDRIRKKIYNDNVKATYNKFNSEDLKGKEIGFKLKDK